MSFVPTTLPFQLRKRVTGGFETGPGPWRVLTRYAYLHEANEALTKARQTAQVDAFCTVELEVHCSPEDVAKVMYEAGIVIRDHRSNLDLANARVSALTMREREALEERGPSKPALPRSCEDQPAGAPAHPSAQCPEGFHGCQLCR